MGEMLAFQLISNIKREENGEEDVMGCHPSGKEKCMVAEVGYREEGLEDSF